MGQIINNMAEGVCLVGAGNGLQVTRELRAAGSELPILFFTMVPASQYLPTLRQAGVQGFLGK